MFTASPSPVPVPGTTDHNGLIVIAILIVVILAGTTLARRAADRYRRRLHGDG